MSASVHSRLTASNSQRRVRSHARSSPEKDELSNDPVSFSPILPLHSDPRLSPIKRITASLHWALTCYCIFSAVLFSLYLFYALVDGAVAGLSTKGGSTVSSGVRLSAVHLLSKSSHLRHTAIELVPNYLALTKARKPTKTLRLDITTCIWTEADNLHETLETLASLRRWSYPISLVVVSSAPPISLSTRRLKAELEAFQSAPSLEFELHVHVLHTLPNSAQSPNAYMNLARLFAPTSHVLIYPGALKKPKSANLLKDILGSLPTESLLGPTLFTETGLRNSSVPTSNLAPLLIPKTHPIWCTERIFSSVSRSADWQECIWQFWLNSFGRMQVVSDTRWSTLVLDWEDKDRHSTSARIYGRLAARFRHESCIMAGKRLRDRSERQRHIGNSKSRWLRKTCKQLLNSWERNLI